MRKESSPRCSAAVAVDSLFTAWLKPKIMNRAMIQATAKTSKRRNAGITKVIHASVSTSRELDIRCSSSAGVPTRAAGTLAAISSPVSSEAVGRRRRTRGSRCGSPDHRRHQEVRRSSAPRSRDSGWKRKRWPRMVTSITLSPPGSPVGISSIQTPRARAAARRAVRRGRRPRRGPAAARDGEVTEPSGSATTAPRAGGGPLRRAAPGLRGRAGAWDGSRCSLEPARPLRRPALVARDPLTVDVVRERHVAHPRRSAGEAGGVFGTRLRRRHHLLLDHGERVAEQVPEEKPAQQVRRDREQEDGHRDGQHADQEVGERESPAHAPEQATQETQRAPEQRESRRDRETEQQRSLDGDAGGERDRDHRAVDQRGGDDRQRPQPAAPAAAAGSDGTVGAGAVLGPAPSGGFPVGAVFGRAHQGPTEALGSVDKRRRAALRVGVRQSNSRATVVVAPSSSLHSCPSAS